MFPKDWTPKFFTMLGEGISGKQIRSDVTAGIIVGIIALPLSIAFAVAAGFSPDKGIITAIIAGLTVSVFGGSRVQIAGPTGAFIVVIAGIIKEFGMSGLLVATFMAGIILILMGVLRLGSLLRYIPQTLITGFTTAIAIIIFSTQIGDFLGLPSGGGDGFVGKWIFCFTNLGSINIWSAAVGILTIAVMLVLPRISRKIPPAFVALTLVSLIVMVFKLPVETLGDRFGNLRFSLPAPTFDFPGWQELPRLIVPAVSIAILGALESLLSAVVSDSMIGGKHRSNIELIAQGAANILTPLFGGLPATGAIARTAANIRNGGRTPLSGIVHSVTLFIVFLFAMPVVGRIPMSALAGILIVVAWNMAEVKTFTASLKINIYETLVLLTTFFLTLFTDLTIAIPVGFVLSTILFMKRMSDAMEINPLVSSKDGTDRSFNQELGEYSSDILIYEIYGPMFFASVHHLLYLENNLKTNHRAVILRFRYVPIVDSSALSRLKSFARELHNRNTALMFSGVNEKVRAKLIQSGISAEGMIFGEIMEALEAAEQTKGQGQA